MRVFSSLLQELSENAAIEPLPPFEAKAALDQPALSLPSIPPTEDSDKSKPASKAASPAPAPSTKPPEDEFMMLAKRFEALKKR